jgi:hypothetical protein
MFNRFIFADRAMAVAREHQLIPLDQYAERESEASDGAWSKRQVLTLSVLQTMTFYLRTGYGLSQKGDGGSPDDPTFGLRQGNGMAPSVITAVSSLMDELYKRLGHASTFAGAWSGILFILDAIIYIDDTDLLILACSHDMSLDACFQ